ncbi:hypothetical protein [Streptosporangium vulgare]|uniref:hypothetical protein n=1 Tax=Streptosporangium vulgare TaxID=46190 RepID=UPI0031CEFBB9
MEQLAFASTTLVNFKDGTYRWVDVKHFRLATPQDDEPLLTALLSHQLYRDDYLGADSWKDGGPVHGPYRLDALSAASFEEIGQEAACATIRTWGRQVRRPPRDDRPRPGGRGLPADPRGHLPLPPPRPRRGGPRRRPGLDPRRVPRTRPDRPERGLPDRHRRLRRLTRPRPAVLSRTVPAHHSASPCIAGRRLAGSLRTAVLSP